jgi:6-phosphogluconate dehydrogenase
MMSCISEAWEIMNKHMGMKYDDIGKVFEKWSAEGELVSVRTFSNPHILTTAEKHLPRQNRCRDLRAKRQVWSPRTR